MKIALLQLSASEEVADNVNKTELRVGESASPAARSAEAYSRFFVFLVLTSAKLRQPKATSGTGRPIMLVVRSATNLPPTAS